MDLICTHCEEPWEIAHVLRKEPRAFKRLRFLVTHCPRCDSNWRDPSSEQRKYLSIASEIGFRFGGDIAFACWLSDQHGTSLLGIFGEKERPIEGKFAIGKVLCGRTALDALENAKRLPFDFLSRHAKGDWGDVSAEDRKENDLSVKTGQRILSSYQTTSREFIWVITDADRSMTTLLLRHDHGPLPGRR